jgi:hypothetical protein
MNRQMAEGYGEMRQRAIVALLLGALLLGTVLCLSGLAATLQFGDAAVRGFLLVPALPTPLYIIMLLVVLAGVGLALLASLLHRRRRPRDPAESPASALPRPLWQSLLSTLATLALFAAAVAWLVRHGSAVQAFIERLHAQVGAIREMLSATPQALAAQVSSPTAGYALFAIVVVIYGGIALLSLWVLLEARDGHRASTSREEARVRRVQRAMAAGLRELHEHQEPRQAIIACYARLEHLLEDHGVPAAHHLTPQEYMGAALRGLELPLEAFAGLVRLFELARYSLHPLDDSARTLAMAHLETLRAHLREGALRVARS